MAVKADAQIGSSLVSLYSVHFESAISEDPRQHQAQEIAEHGLRTDRLAIVGGDFNSGYLSLEIENGGQWDLTTEQFTDRGYVDAHDSLDLEERVTAPERGFILDLIMANQDIFTEAGVCQAAECTGLSDHQPVWAKIEIP